MSITEEKPIKGLKVYIFKGAAGRYVYEGDYNRDIAALEFERDTHKKSYSTLAHSWSEVISERDSLRSEIEHLRLDADKWQTVQSAIDQLQSNERNGSIWSVCSRLLISVAHKINAGTSTVTEEGVTIDGKEVGDWRVTVERIDLIRGQD